ncbi:MAG TPA: TerB family tellurite resistance protein [Candidatus Limnocylindrales bacterium]
MRFLGGRPGATPAPDTAGYPSLDAETEAVRRIVARLEALPPDTARLMAGMAYVLARAANADLDISDVETAAMEQELTGAGLDQSQAVLVVEMAKLQEKTSGGTSDYLVTRDFREHSTEQQRLALLRACYHVASADDAITSMESSILFEIAGELDLSRDDAAQIRADFADKVTARFDFKGPGAGRS